MNSVPDIKLALDRARKFHESRHLAEAEEAYGQLLTPGEHRKYALDALAEIYLQTGRPVDAANMLTALTAELPDSLSCHAKLADLLDRLGQTETAIKHFQRLIDRQPKMAAAHYNVALLHKKVKAFAECLAAYEQAVRLGIDDVHEVYSNMGVLYSEMQLPEKAEEMYKLALTVNPRFTPALFNLAGLHETKGDRTLAIELYEEILSLEPTYWDALARLANATKVASADDTVISRLKDSIEDSAADALGQEALYFALGKVLDELGQYDDAFAAYRAANLLGMQRNPSYDTAATERAFDQLIDLFDSKWIAATKRESMATPIFICGMFRSGSTLVEQILAGHSAVIAAGEIDVLAWLVGRELAPYPHGVKNASQERLGRVGDAYLSKLDEMFPEHDYVTDKRPENFLHLGLIKVLFPAAKIIYTKREPLDNCLSVYFQQFGGNLNYATDLKNITHYQQQQDRLMAHWTACFGEEIFVVDYDKLVQSPESVLRRLTKYLGLTWDDQLLEFEKSGALVNTASIWQVREGLHTRSSGRWRNYEASLQGLSSGLHGN